MKWKNKLCRFKNLFFFSNNWWLRVFHTNLFLTPNEYPLLPAYRLTIRVCSPSLFTRRPRRSHSFSRLFWIMKNEVRKCCQVEVKKGFCKRQVPKQSPGLHAVFSKVRRSKVWWAWNVCSAWNSSAPFCAASTFCRVSNPRCLDYGGLSNVWLLCQS